MLACADASSSHQARVRPGIARGLTRMDGGANGGSQATWRAAPACPHHPDGPETSRTDSGRRLALLGRQGLDLGQAADRRPRTVRRRGWDRPLQDLAWADGGRGCAAADARLPGLAVL